MGSDKKNGDVDISLLESADNPSDSEHVVYFDKFGGPFFGLKIHYSSSENDDSKKKHITKSNLHLC
jgi:hypothetical protein